MGDPRVSVIMPVYNAQAFLGEAVRSILGQRYREFELITVDDGSSDGSKVLLEAFADQDARVRVVSRPHTGYTVALNDGVSAATCELIARMDADDVAYPRRLERQVEYLDTHPECVVLGTAWRYRHPGDRYVDLDPETRRQISGSHDTILNEMLVGHNIIAHPTVMFRRSAYDRAGGGYDPLYEPAEDLELWFRMSQFGQLAILDEVLLDYRVHTQSVCSQRGIESIGTVVKAVRAALRRRGETRRAAMVPVYRHSVQVSLAVNRRGMALGYAYRAWAAAPLSGQTYWWIMRSLVRSG
ncbi:MAG: glycosyltransferase [Planctomycetes bacterium]|nr:glycosyltransferase [Planctomycetota bacterium]